MTGLVFVLNDATQFRRRYILSGKTPRRLILIVILHFNQLVSEGRKVVLCASVLRGGGGWGSVQRPRPTPAKGLNFTE